MTEKYEVDVRAGNWKRALTFREELKNNVTIMSNERIMGCATTAVSGGGKGRGAVDTLRESKE